MTSDALFETPVPPPPGTGQTSVPAHSGEGLPGTLVLEVHVFGTPAPQGSKHGRPVYKGRGEARAFTGKVAQVESSKYVKPWREAVKQAARDVLSDDWPLLAEPVYVETTYTFARPRSHYRTGRFAHLLRDNAPLYPVQIGRNDIEKLTRASRDALTDAGVWRDDAFVVDERNRKVYPGAHPDALPVAGAVIRIFTLLPHRAEGSGLA